MTEVKIMETKVKVLFAIWGLLIAFMLWTKIRI
jgi:hypothetical protein